MVGRDLGRDVGPVVFRPPNDVDASFRRHVAQVHMSTRQLGEGHVAGHHDLFDRCGNAFEAETCRDDPLVHDTALREVGILTVLGNGDAECLRVLQHGTHEVAGRDGVSVVAHSDRAGFDQLGEFRHLLALLPQRHGPVGKHPSAVRRTRLLDRKPNCGFVVDHRVGVRHRAYRRESAGGRRPRPGRDRFGALVPRLSQMHVDVN